jgi:hypothetical protein
MVLLDKKKATLLLMKQKKFIEQILSKILKEMIEEQFNPFSSSDIKKWSLPTSSSS